MQQRQFYFLLIAAALLFVSCGKTNTQGRLIPKDASFVLLADGKSLSSKLSWEEIKQNPLFTEAAADSTIPAELKAILENPDNAGIDIKDDLLFFVQKDSTGGYICFEGKIKDADLFKKFNSASGGSSSEKDGVDYISKAPVCVGWDKEKFVYIMDVPGFNKMDELNQRMQRDSIDISSLFPKRDVLATCLSIFSLKENNSLAKSAPFTKLVKKTGDIRLWLNSEELYKGMGMMIPFLNLEKLYKGNISTAVLNFENGKIQLKGESYAGEELTNLYKKYGGGKVSEDMLKRMPGKDINGLLALSFKPQALVEFAKLLGVDGIINGSIQKELGITMDDFIKANKGDILIGISDLKIERDTSKALFKDQEQFALPAVPKPSFNFVFAASVGDKDAFNKLIAAGQKLGGQFLNPNSAPFQYSSNGTYFSISNTKENADKFLNSAASAAEFIDKISGEPFGGYINIQSLLRSFEKEAALDSAAKVAYDASLKMWDNIQWKGGAMDGEVMTQSVEINLLDKTVNSLKQLNQYAAKLSQLYQQKKQQEKAERMAFEDFNASDSLPPLK